MQIPISSSLTQLNAEAFISEGYELSLDAIVPSIELTGSFTPFQSKTQFFVYNNSQQILHEALDYNANGSYLPPSEGSTILPSSSSYNQFELTPTEDIYNLGYSSGDYYAVYNFIDYELGSEAFSIEENGSYEQHPYFIKDISGDRTELRIQNNFLSSQQIETFYNQFNDKLNARENVDEFYVSFGGNRNFIGVNSQLETSTPNSPQPTSILIKLYKPLPSSFKIDEEIQIISKVGESRVFKVEFQPNLEFIDNLLSIKGPNYNISIKDKVNNSTNFKSLNDLVNTASSQSYYQFNSLRDQKGIAIRKNWADWSQFVHYSSAEARLNNFKDKLISIESSSAALLELDGVLSVTKTSIDYTSSYASIENDINNVISKFDSYEYFLYYITGSDSWPKFSSTYPYSNYSVTSSVALDWFGSTNELSPYYNSGKNQIYSASRYDNDNQDYLYYLIPPFITNNSNNDQYVKFVNMTGQTFDEMHLYTEAVEQIRNTNSGLTGSVLPLGMADEVIESLGFDTSGNSFNSIGFNPNNIGVFPSTGSGLEYITRYVDIASGSVINYYDQQQSTLGYVVALADPSFPYPLDNAAQEIYKRIFHNMVSLVKRKGTVTGLRQLINIWGVPSTMLRISEFGGKNKNDENDYDLWMNRYSNAMSTIPISESISSTTKPSGSIRIPWQPLTSNYVDGNAPSSYYSVPDCIQFRFKPQQPTSATANFSQSLLVKGDLYDGTADFAVTLAYSGSQSGSFSGSVLPNDNQYGNLTFHLSGSSGQGGILSTLPISLPFFNGSWWSVQIQRLTNQSASLSSTTNDWELRVANNIYDGYDGNQIGFQGSASIDSADAGSSHTDAWNDIHGVTTLSPSGNSFAKGYSAVALGGMMDNGTNNENTFIGSGTNPLAPLVYDRINIGEGFLGDFQEFRFYRRAMSASQFNDYVMNPESIQGHADSNTGAGSSYDLLSFRLPLGNELEYNEVSGSANDVGWNNAQGGQVKFLSFGGNSFFSGENAFGSLHPSLVNRQGSLFTSSFITTNNTTSSQYGIAYQGRTGAYTSTITSSYLKPNTEINYMDQPSAGIRNRIKNKIQVIDGNEYGTILSPFRSIQQEFEQSSSYTEDLNSLEVGFSFQNEINDDIIATFGHGVVSDAIADPRFISESSDRYPELTRIAEDYFKKYQGTAVTDPTYNGGLPTIIEKEYDYNRLIKFYETSLFRAIKNYIPARTSLSTGIIVKQHLLERNKVSSAIGINTNTPIAKTPETGSDVYGYTNQTGFNSVISQRNLLITSSIEMYSLTGSAGGSVNEYNSLSYNNNDLAYITWQAGGTAGQPNLSSNSLNLFTNESLNNDHQNLASLYGKGSGSLEEGGGYLEFERALTTNIYLDVNFNSGTTPNTMSLDLISDKRGVIYNFTQSIPAGVSPNPFPYLLPIEGTHNDELFTFYPGEKIQLLAKTLSGDLKLQNHQIIFGNVAQPGYSTVGILSPTSSQQVNWYRDDYTGLLKVKDTQEEFYDGEFSGSNIPTIPAQYNPYRIFADGNDKTPDIIPADQPYVDFTQATPGPYFSDTYITVDSANQVSVTPGYSPTSNYVSLQNIFQNLKVGRAYEVGITVTNFANIVPTNYLQVGLTGVNSNVNNPWDEALRISGNGNFRGGDNPPLGNIVKDNDGSPTFNHLTFTATDDGTAGIADAGAINWYANGVSADFTITVNYIREATSLGPKHFYERDAFTIVPTSSWLFQNSPYNPIINNVSSSRKNSFLFDMDFDPVIPGATLIEGIPSDYTLTISSSQLGWEGTATADALLEFSEVPDSNYTTTAIVNPRYNGSKITSADYNFRITEMNLSESAVPNSIISPLRLPGLQKESKIKFLNGETGSWKGDSTNEYQSAIDTRPIYFAHFKSSYENYELYNSTTFDIDQLIQVPFDSIQSEQAPIITSSQLNGNNENLVAVGSTFTPNRKAKSFYNQSTKQFRNLKKHLSPSDHITISPILDYTTADNNSNYITFPAQEVLSYYTNEKTQQEVVVTHSINAPIWVKDSINYNPTIGAGRPIWQIINTNNNNALNASSNPLTQSIQPLPLNSDAASTTLLVTGSSPNGDLKGYGLLYLQGMATNGEDLYQWNFGASTPAIQSRDLNAPHLQLINTINHNIDIGDISYSTSQNPYLFPDETINTQVTNSCAQWSPLEDDLFGTWPFTVSTFVNNCLSSSVTGPGAREGGGLPSFPSNPLKTIAQKGIQNYFTYNYSMSVLSEYTEKTLPIMIERGDEIRVTYASPLLTDATSNTSKTNEIITQTFQVLGYEQAPPSLLFGKPLEYNGTSKLGWGSNTAMQAVFGAGSNEFEAIAGNLPPTGLFSPDSLKEKFDLLSTNQQNVIGVGKSTNDNFDNAFTGSIVSCKIESRWGEISGSSTTVAPTGSIKVKFRGYQGAVDTNKPVRVMSIQQILRTTMRGVSGSYAEADNEDPITSKFAYCLTGGTDYNPLDAGFMFDTLKVTPNPATLAKPIPSGSIMSATFKKRIDNDTKVVVNVTQPPGNEGALTPSGDGYLIPDDLTSTQMDNVQKIINVLKSQNSFTNPPDANETNDVG